MGKKVVLLNLILLLLLSTVVAAASVQRTVGVSVGDWFRYSYTANWSSNDPNASPPADFKSFNETAHALQYAEYDISAISGTNVTAQVTAFYKNGTQITVGGWVDVDDGTGLNLTGWFISANLVAGNPVYSAGVFSTANINETIPRTYSNSTRDTNHLNITTLVGTTAVYFNNLYWDKLTGASVELLLGETNQTGAYTTTWSEQTQITSSKVWVVPEFAPSTLTLLMLIVLTPAVIAMYKRRPH